jgi:hypothetical protein
MENMAARLIKGFNCGQHIPVGKRLGFREYALGTILIDVKTEDLSTKLAVNEDSGWSGGGIGWESVGLRQRSEAAKNQQSQAERYAPGNGMNLRDGCNVLRVAHFLKFSPSDGFQEITRVVRT